MKFLYQYRTPDNELHKGVISAASKDAAYVALKAQGMRPGRVEEAPGFFNKLFGKGKRWIAIYVLGIMVAVAGFVIWSYNRTIRTIELSQNVTPRAQLYGDPVLIDECVKAGWTNVFSSAFDCYLARYSIPGKKMSGALAILEPPTERMDVHQLLAFVEVKPTDLAEIVQMKRMVNGMKQELSEYLAAGGTVVGYMKRLNIRQQAEHNLYEAARRQFKRSKTPVDWKAKNAELRALGLPMVGVEENEI